MVAKEIRTHIEAGRIKRTSNGLILTPKGNQDFLNWKQTVSVEAQQKREKDYTAKGVARHNSRYGTGQFRKKRE